MLCGEVYDSTSNVTGIQADNSSTVLGSTNHAYYTTASLRFRLPAKRRPAPEFT